MWLTVAMLVTPAIWLAIRADNCGKRLPVISLPQPHDGSKTEARPNSWPWHVGLYYSGYGAFPFCGGTLISPTWVLSAAHCFRQIFSCNNITLGRKFAFEKNAKEKLAVKVGSHNIKNDHPRAYNILVKKVIIHPLFELSGPNEDADFAMLKLTRKVKRSQTVDFACLPKSGFKFNEGKECFIAGWGKISLPIGIFPYQPEVLMEKPVTIAKLVFCAKLFYPNPSEKEICVQESLMTTCNGDSGGGMHCPTKDGTWTLYGVLSRGSDRCNKGGSIFGATDYALPWIKGLMRSFN